MPPNIRTTFENCVNRKKEVSVVEVVAVGEADYIIGNRAEKEEDNLEVLNSIRGEASSGDSTL